MYRNMILGVAWLLIGLVLSVAGAAAQGADAVQLTVHLRSSDGTAVIGESVILQRLPEEEPLFPECITNGNGECTWIVGRGLYQVLFERPLDNISALAVAEGGLHGLGMTVGDEDITYHFTFHSDGRVYFDAAPEAAVPSPIIPVGDMLHGGIKPTLTRTGSGSGESVSKTPTPEPTADSETAVDTTSGNSWRLILFIGGGMFIGGGLHLLRHHSGQVWSRKRQTPNRKSSIQNRKSEDANA